MTGSEPPRNLAAFWLLGLSNNFAYVIMLSAAHDILNEQEGKGNSSHNASSGIHMSAAAEAINTSGNHSHLIEYCNPIGTGAILLADILPTLIIKLFAPFFIQKIPYSIKVSVVVLFAAASFPIVAVSQIVPISILGVICASASAGLGEITFLSLSSFYDKNTVSTWSSGTGAAGVFGALSYAGLTAIGLSPRITLFIMLVVPFILAVSYFLLLKNPVSVDISMCSANDSTALLAEEGQDHNEEENNKSIKKKGKQSLLEKIKLIKPLLKYMVPLGLVYFAEYFINQALFELIYFKNIWLPVNQQYRWYQVIYQIGVLLSRSSVNLFVINRLWILPILQWLNIGVLLVQVFTGFIPTIWIVFILILYEGLLGGFAYVNTFYKISKEVEEDKREFSMGVTSVSDSTGIALAGFVSIPVHNFICNLQK